MGCCKGDRRKESRYREKLLQHYDSVGAGCVECGLCQKNCRFLQQYGNPKEIALRKSLDPDVLRTSFECSLCWLCTAVCPKEIDPASMFAAMRRQAVATGHGEFAQHRALLRYEQWGASSAISWYGLPEGCHTVLFPGCAMAGSRSQRVLDLYLHIRKEIPSLGMVLDCCTKPSFDLGRMQYFSTMFGTLRDALAAHGVKRVLVACPSCYRVWKDHGGPIAVTSIYEQLAGQGPFRKISFPVEVTLHDPCPTRHEPAIHAAVRHLVASMGLNLREMKHHGGRTICCGEGGAACYTAPDFAGNWTATRAKEAEGRYMVTYCAGCTQFLGRLSPVGHVADLFFEPRKTLEGRVPVARSPVTWLKRILLKRRLRKVVPARETGTRGRDGSILFREGLGGERNQELTDDERLRKIKEMYVEHSKGFPEVDEVTPEEILERQRTGSVIFVDTRSEEEQTVSMIPGSLTESELLADPARYREKELVAYCTIGYRSGKFVRKQRRDFPRIKNLQGGVLAWLHAGGRVAAGGREVKLVHVYGPRWALQPKGYRPVFMKG